MLKLLAPRTPFVRKFATLGLAPSRFTAFRQESSLLTSAYARSAPSLLTGLQRLELSKPFRPILDFFLAQSLSLFVLRTCLLKLLAPRTPFVQKSAQLGLAPSLLTGLQRLELSKPFRPQLGRKKKVCSKCEQTLNKHEDIKRERINFF